MCIVNRTGRYRMKVYSNLLDLIGFILFLPGLVVLIWDYLHGSVRVFSVALMILGLAVMVVGNVRAKRSRGN